MIAPGVVGICFFVGYKYHTVTYAAVIGCDADGEVILGDKKSQAPYAYWMCALGHVETDGY